MAEQTSTLGQGLAAAADKLGRASSSRVWEWPSDWIQKNKLKKKIWLQQLCRLQFSLIHLAEVALHILTVETRLSCRAEFSIFSSWKVSKEKKKKLNQTNLLNATTPVFGMCVLANTVWQSVHKWRRDRVGRFHTTPTQHWKLAYF